MYIVQCTCNLQPTGTPCLQIKLFILVLNGPDIWLLFYVMKPFWVTINKLFFLNIQYCTVGLTCIIHKIDYDFLYFISLAKIHIFTKKSGYCLLKTD